MGAATSQDEHARFTALARRYARLIRSAVGRVAGPSAESIADDVEQRVLMAVWKAMPGEQIPDHPSSYLYRAAVRETVRLLRDERRREATPPEEIGDVRDSRPDPDRIAASKQLADVVAQELDEMAEERARAVRAHLAGFDVREIMLIHDWPYNRARNLISRGMIDLRRRLAARGIRG